ncbi:hypothetical protein ABEM20_24260, partial [Escherichia coli]
VPAYGPQNDVTLKMPAFEWVHVQLHQQKGMISLSPPTICNSANPPTLPGAGAVWESAHLAGRRCRVGIRPPCRAPVLCGNPPIFMTKICQMTGSCVLIYVRRDFAYHLDSTSVLQKA